MGLRPWSHGCGCVPSIPVSSSCKTAMFSPTVRAKQISGITGLLPAHLQYGQMLMKASVDECVIRYHRCLGPALHKIGSCGLWLFYHLAFMVGTGFQSIFLIWPAASSWSAAADVLQPFVVAQLWLVAAQSCSQDGCWNAGMCNSVIAAGKPWSHGVESCWALSCGWSPLWAAGTQGEAEIWAWFVALVQGAPSLGSSAWARLSSNLCTASSSPQPPPQLERGRDCHSEKLQQLQREKEDSAWEQDGLSWKGEGPCQWFWGSYAGAAGFGKAVEGPWSRKREWGHETELGVCEELRKSQQGDFWGKS